MSNKKVLIVIGGPTAAGKSALAMQLALHFQCPILSADSRQFYIEMNIGTAKPSKEELGKTVHYFIDFLSVEDDYSVGDFEREAIKLLEEIFQEHSKAILVGGSGLYIKAVCEGLDVFPEISPEVKFRVQKMYEEEGLEALQEALKKADPEYHQKVDLQNPHRLIRALSVCFQSGKPFSGYLNQPKKARSFAPIYLWLEMDRTLLYQRINDRVDQMVVAGLVEEARELYPKKSLNALQTVGYQELFEHFDGKISLEEGIELIKRNSRRYAKRQLTWFRNQTNWPAFHPNDFTGILNFINQSINQDYGSNLE